MSVLLRRPATVPALFARSLDEDTPSPRTSAGRRRVVLLAVACALGVTALIDVPLVRAAPSTVLSIGPG